MNGQIDEPILVDPGYLRDFAEQKRLLVEFPYRGALWAVDADKIRGRWEVYLHFWGADGRGMDDVVTFEEENDLADSVVIHQWTAPEDDLAVLSLVGHILADRNTLKRIIDEKGVEHIERVAAARERCEWEQAA